MRWKLSTNHSASSYGQPVVVVNGEAFGKADVLPDGQIAVDVVRAALPKLKGEQKKLAEKFAGGFPF